MKLSSTTEVVLTLLLHPSCRSSESIERTAEIATQMDMVPIGKGKVSLSVKMNVQNFNKLFGQFPKVIPKQEPGPTDFGARPAFMAEEELPVPKVLLPLVESITITPPERRF